MRRLSDSLMLLGAGMILASLFMTGDIRTWFIYAGFAIEVGGILATARI